MQRLARLLALALGFGLALPSTLRAAQPTQPQFEVATVKLDPGGDPRLGFWSIPNKGEFRAEHVTLTRLFQLAYNIDASQIANRPSWMDTELYSVLARPEEGVALSREELRPGLQALLRERLHLVCHTELRQRRGYALVSSETGTWRPGPGIVPTKGDHFPGYRIDTENGHMEGCNWTMATLAQYLTPVTGFPVTDETGIKGSYDIAFTFDPTPDDTPDTGSNQPRLETALRRATGLELRVKTVPVQTVVIDSVDRVPVEN
ncbi:TIGR03435 family protein [Terriglobus tenax]|uniref:TIGR03435 family protein n=1 Tax=Terriglobus tenax TaxID=1111115 RepID=UPI0021DF8B8F|nr:TIGR03435 family protein [Terriglobus tenax]